VKLLLEKGGEDLEALNKKGETCLFRAVTRGDKDIVQLLLEHGADPMERPPGSDSTLHIASYQGSKAVLKLLVDKSKGQLEDPNSKGETPLYVALQRRHNSCIEILLEAGANPNARPAGKDSMLHIAITNNAKSIAKMLLQRGVDVEELKGGETPLYRGKHPSPHLMEQY
jgi:ankyrin repeat protein